VRKVDARDAFVFVAFAEQSLVVEQAQLLNDVIHDQVGVDCRFASNQFFVSLAQLTHLVNSKTLVRV
jgi:hypothetical protein